MKEVHLTKGPFIHTNNKVKNINNSILIALIPLVIFAFYKNGIVLYSEKGDLLTLFLPLILMITSGLVSLLSDYLISRIRKENKKFNYFLTNKYSFLPGLILAIMLPINIPIWILVLGSFLVPLFGKINYAGITMLNPTVLALSLCFILNSSELFKTIEVSNVSLWNLFFGNIGLVTSSFLSLLAFLYLIYKKAIKWRIPLTYIATVFIMTYIIGVLNNQTLYYPLFQILSGGLLFGAIFLAGNETSPTTSFGQVTYAVFLGILTIIFRFYVSDILSIFLSILIMNLFNMVIDELGAFARFGLKKGSILILIQIILVLGISLYIAENREIKVDGIVNEEKI